VRLQAVAVCVDSRELCLRASTPLRDEMHPTTADRWDGWMG
jgi:hypothetical protein